MIEKVIQTPEEIKNLQQLPNQLASDFADYIWSRPNQCASTYGPNNEIQILIYGIAYQIREQTTRYWSDHPGIDLEFLASFANGLRLRHLSR